ncbi:MAG: DNA double-strand break repair nuclease NurA [Candidatus Asgardarchaeia archaeon]
MVYLGPPENFERWIFMLDELLEKAASKREKILRTISKLELKVKEDDVKKYWIEYEPEEYDYTNIGAEDGSFNTRRYKNFEIFAVCAEAISYVGGKMYFSKAADVDVMKPFLYVRDRVRFYMSILEKKTALESLREHGDTLDVFFLDGSLIGDIIRPTAYEKRPKKVIKEYVKEKYFPKVKREVDNGKTDTISSKELIDEIAYDDFLKGNMISATIYLEYLENLYTLSRIMEFSKKIVSVSKTARSNDYFEKYGVITPDIVLFEKYCKTPGYSIMKEKAIVDGSHTSEKYKRAFPILEDFFRGKRMTIFYARLEEDGPMLKFEVPARIDEDEVKRILSIAKSMSVKGYPYLLRKAHRDAIIRNRDMMTVIKVIRIIEKTGREFLGK